MNTPYSQATVDRAVKAARKVTQTEDDPYGRPMTRCAIQMLVQEIDRLKVRIEALEEKNQELKAEVESLEYRLAEETEEGGPYV